MNEKIKSHLQNIEDQQLKEHLQELLEDKVLQNDWKELLEDKRKLFEIISYKFGPPLNSLKVLSDLFVSALPTLPAEMILEYAQHIDQQIHTLQKQMQNLICWADFEVDNFSFRPQNISIEKLLSETIKKYQNNADKKGVTLIFLSQNTENQVFADPKLLTLLLENVLVNAIKFSHRGGQISWQTDKQADFVKVCLADAGIGISELQKEKLFEKKKSQPKGTAGEDGLGLGMLLVKKIVDLHQMRWQLESQKGKGTTFSFWIPCA